MEQATHERNGRGGGWAVLGGLGLGALIMYLADPQAGRRRRARLRDKAVHAAKVARHGADVVSRDASNRLQGLRATVLRAGHPPSTEDVVLMERVRAALGRVTSHPHAIQVGAHEGHVVVSGVALSHESDAILRTIGKVPGVKSLEDHLDLHESAGRTPSLQGGVAREKRMELMQDHWSPAWRVLAGAAGAGLALAGWIRGGLAGLALGGVGGGLAARAAANRDLKSLVERAGSRPAPRARQASGRPPVAP